MFWTSLVHLQERFLQAVRADLVCGNTRVTRHVRCRNDTQHNTLHASETPWIVLNICGNGEVLVNVGTIVKNLCASFSISARRQFLTVS